MFRRAVLVDRPVRSQGVIGHRLIQTSFKPGLEGLAGRVEHNNCVLVPEKSRVKFLDVAGAESTFAFHEGKEALQDLSVVLYDPRNQLRISIRGVMRNVRRVNSALDQRPRNPRSEERRVGKECRSRWSPY